MTSLLAVLGSIGLLDSTSMFPLAIPILLAFLAGIVAVYLPSGMLLTQAGRAIP